MLSMFFASVTARLPAETWTDNKGRSLEAVVSKYDLKRGGVEFVLPNGKKIRHRISALSKESQDQLQAHHEARMALLQPGNSFKRHPAGHEKYTWHCQIPSNFDIEKPPPLLIAFSPGGNGKSMVNHFKASCEKMGWILVGCDYLSNGIDLPGDEEDKVFMLMYEDMQRTLTFHPYRVYLGGMSGGAMRSFGITSTYKERPWAGIIALGGWMGRKYDVDYTTHLAVVRANGTRDAAANSWLDRDREVLEKYAARIRDFSFEGGHVMPPQDVTQKLLDWLEQDWRQVGMKLQVKKSKEKK